MDTGARAAGARIPWACGIFYQGGAGGGAASVELLQGIAPPASGAGGAGVQDGGSADTAGSGAVADQRPGDADFGRLGRFFLRKIPGEMKGLDLKSKNQTLET